MTGTEEELPSPGRVVLGFVLGPLAGGLLLGVGAAVLLRQPAAVFLGLYGLVIGYPAALFLGLPAYILLRRRVRLTVWNAAAAGAVMAAIPLAAFSAVMAAQGILRSDEVGGAGQMTAGALLPGALAGAVFWRVLRGPRPGPT